MWALWGPSVKIQWLEVKSRHFFQKGPARYGNGFDRLQGSLLLDHEDVLFPDKVQKKGPIEKKGDGQPEENSGPVVFQNFITDG